MQYLAKVHTASLHNSAYLRAAQTGAANLVDSHLGDTQLHLLAVNTDDHIWELVTPPRMIAVSTPIVMKEQMLVLLELDADNQVVSVEDATQWVLKFVADYLSIGITPKGLKEDLERAEQWRQSLTLQSQEVRRRVLETAARRDEIQDLEKRLKLERESLESNLGKKE
ncbi:MAG: hypothetical protein WBA76_07785 [Phormidesmis sp.]